MFVTENDGTTVILGKDGLDWLMLSSVVYGESAAEENHPESQRFHH